MCCLPLVILGPDPAYAASPSLEREISEQTERKDAVNTKATTSKSANELSCERRIVELETCAERREAELSELRVRMHQLREDFKYNLSLLSERDAELDRYDTRFAWLKDEDKLRMLLKEELVAAEEKTDLRIHQRTESEPEADHVHRAAEMHKALDKEWHIRDEALLRHREELDTHKLALMQQISEREELLETQQTSILVSAAQDVCRAQEKANVRLNAADAVSSLSAGKIFVLERQVESLRNRLRHLEKEAAAAKFAKESAEAAASEAFRERTTESWEMDARMAELHERCADAERRAECNAEDAASAAAAAAAAVRLAEAAAEDVRVEATAIQKQRDSKHAAELSSLSAQFDTLLRRAEMAEHALQEKRAAAETSVSALQEHLVKASAHAAKGAESTGSDISQSVFTSDEMRTIKDLFISVKTEVAEAGEKIHALRAILEERDADISNPRIELAAAKEHAHVAAKAVAKLRGSDGRSYLVSGENDAADRILTFNDLVRLKTHTSGTDLESRVAAENTHSTSPVSTRQNAEMESESTRQSLAVQTDDVRVGFDGFSRQVQEKTSLADRLVAENERLRGCVGAMRTEMELLQRSLLNSPNGRIVSDPDWSPESNPCTEALKCDSEELRLSRAEVERLTREKVRLLEISNGLRAKLDHLTGTGRHVREYEDGKLLTKFGVIIGGNSSSTNHATENTSKSCTSFPRYASERATLTQRTRVRKNIEKSKVRNWNLRD